MSAPQTAPRLTAMLLMPRGFDELTGALTHFRAQTIRSQIQVVIVARRGREREVDPRQFDGFAALDVVAVDAMPTVASGFAAGVRCATAEVVALVEDHVFVEPDWAARVCEAFSDGCAAVAPLMLNANPGDGDQLDEFPRVLHRGGHDGRGRGRGIRTRSQHGVPPFGARAVRRRAPAADSDRAELPLSAAGRRARAARGAARAAPAHEHLDSVRSAPPGFSRRRDVRQVPRGEDVDGRARGAHGAGAAGAAGSSVPPGARPRALAGGRRSADLGMAAGAGGPAGARGG